MRTIPAICFILLMFGCGWAGKQIEWNHRRKAQLDAQRRGRPTAEDVKINSVGDDGEVTTFELSVTFQTTAGFNVIGPEWIPEHRKKDVAKLIDKMWNMFRLHWRGKGMPIKVKPKEMTIIIHPRINAWYAWIGNKFVRVSGVTLRETRIIIVSWNQFKLDRNPIGALFHEWCHMCFDRMAGDHKGGVPEPPENRNLWVWADLQMHGGLPRLPGGRLEKFKIEEKKNAKR